MREQQKSKLEKHGEGKAHEKAKTRLVNILMDAGWEVFPDCRFWVAWHLQSQNGTTLQKEQGPQFDLAEYYHEFDIYCRKRHDNGLVSELIVEIDGSAHDSKVQQGKDKTAEEYARFFLPDALFVRIPIAELIAKQSLSDDHLARIYKIK